MRIAFAVVALLLAGCSTTECKNCGNPDRVAHVFLDTDDDGLPDTRAGLMGLSSYGVATFSDDNDDGLPDTRLVHVDSSRESRIEVKLIELENAIAELRRELRRR